MKENEIKRTIKVLKPELLTNYGFKEEYVRYYYVNCNGHNIIEVSKPTHRNRTPYIMHINSYYATRLTQETLFLFVKMINDGVIEFVEETKRQVIEHKIAKLQNEIKKLESELE